MPGLPVLHHLPELAQTHVHWISDAIQSSHPLSSPFPPVLNLSQQQGLLEWVSSSHQISKVLELQLSISPFNDYSELYFFRMDWFDLHGTPKSPLEYHSSKGSILRSSDFIMIQLSCKSLTTGKPWRKKRKPPPGFSPGESGEHRSLVGYSLWGCKELDKTEWLSTQEKPSFWLYGPLLAKWCLCFLICCLVLSLFSFQGVGVLISWLQKTSTVILEPNKIKYATASTFSPPIWKGVMGPDAMILVLWMLRLKPTFSLALSYFTFIRRLFSSSLLSATRVVWYAHLRLLIFLLAILIPACVSSSPAFHMMYSAYKLNKQGDNI